MTTILIVGASDTGRAPMAAALLRRLIETHSHPWFVESAGVLGHDEAPAEIEARDTMTSMGLDIGDHQARSLTDALVARAALLLAIDSGTAAVARARFPDAADRIHALGALAGRQRDIPDPFRMQIGAWMTYAHEIASLLDAALPRMRELLPAADNGTEDRRDAQRAPQLPTAAQITAERAEASARIERLLQLAAEMPGVVDWAAARLQIDADLGRAVVPAAPDDLVAAYVGLLHAALTLTPLAPTPGQLTALRNAARRLAAPIDQADLNNLSAQLGGWAMQ